MGNVNRATLLGRVGRDPEIRYSANGKTIASFSLATSEKYQGNEKTEWHNITAFGPVADVCANYVKKWDQIYVEGAIRYEEWEKDGITKYRTKIVALNVQLLGGGKTKEKETFDPDAEVPF